MLMVRKKIRREQMCIRDRYEALNNAAELKTNFIIIINDNNMSISRNVGGMSTYLSALRTARCV